MLIYWTMFVTPLLAGLSPFRPDPTMRRILYGLIFLTMTVVIGGRDVIGCDWDSYLNHYYIAADSTLSEVLGHKYPAYGFVNWSAVQLGQGIHLVNTACGAIFAFGFIAFMRRQPRPWLLFVTAVPYLIIVVSMGFTRQAVAIGILLLAFNAFVDRKLIWYLAFVGFAALFHSTAVALAPLAIFIERRRSLSPLVIGGAGAAFLFLAILSSLLDRYIYAYIEQGYEGEGALYRLPLNAAAGLAMLMFRKRWFQRFEDGRLYLILAVISLAILPFAFIFPVVADRMSMYVLPFQIAVAARMPDLVAPKYRMLTGLGVVLAYGISLYVWLNYANHAHCWVPYSSIYF